MITYPAAWALVAMAILVGLTVIFRTLPARTHGRHRAGRSVTVPFAELMPDWPGPGGIAAQTFVNCPVCGPDTAATVHGDAVLCAAGHVAQNGGSS